MIPKQNEQKQNWDVDGRGWGIQNIMRSDPSHTRFYRDHDLVMNIDSFEIYKGARHIDSLVFKQIYYSHYELKHCRFSYTITLAFQMIILHGEPLDMFYYL